MIKLAGKENLKEAIDVLCAFETLRHPSSLAVEDIKSSLFWCDPMQCYSIDVGFALRGGADEIRIYKKTEDDEDDWFPSEETWTPVAFLSFNKALYFFFIRY